MLAIALGAPFTAPSGAHTPIKCRGDACPCPATPPSPSRPASVRPYCQRDEDDEDTDTPRKRLPDRRGIRLVEEQPTYRVDDQRNWLVFCEGAQPVRHALCRHERAAGEGQGKEPDEASRLCRLHAPHRQPDHRRDPRESKAGEQEESRCRQPGHERALWSEANQQTNGPHYRHNECIARYVSNGTARQDGRFGHRQGAKAVDQAALQVSSQADAGSRRAKDDSLSEDSGHQVIDIAGTFDRNCSAKHVAEEQDEHNRLDRRKDEFLRDTWNLDQVALRQYKRISKCPVESRTRLRRQCLGRANINAVHRALLTRGSVAGVAAGSSVSSAGRPVSVRKTSSRVGRRNARSSRGTCAASRSRTTSARRCAPCVTGTTRWRRSMLIWSSPEL